MHAIVQAQHIWTGQVEAKVSDDMKFQIFKTIVDELFITLSNFTVSNFPPAPLVFSAG